MSVPLGIIGVGYWGATLVRALHETPGAELVAAWDTRGDRLEALVRRYPAVHRATSLGEMLSDPGIEAILIATSAASHVELASRALGSGKHVFVEKPFALSSAEAAALVWQAAALRLVLMPGHTFLYSPAVDAIRELITTGSLGEILAISATRVNLGIHRPDVNVVWDLGVHDLSIFQHWLGRAPTHVGAVARACVPGHAEDVAFISLNYSSGTIAHMELSWFAPSKRRRMTVVGSRKMVEYVDGDDAPVRVFDASVEHRLRETLAVSYRRGDRVVPSLSNAEPLVLQMADFCDAVQHGTTPRSTGILGLDVIRVLEAVDASLAERGQQVEVAPV